MPWRKGAARKITQRMAIKHFQKGENVSKKKSRRKHVPRVGGGAGGPQAGRGSFIRYIRSDRPNVSTIRLGKTS